MILSDVYSHVEWIISLTYIFIRKKCINKQKTSRKEHTGRKQ